MTTPSPQPQPDGDWADRCALAIQGLRSTHWDDGEMDLADVANTIRSFAPAPATTNEGAVNELVEAVEPFNKIDEPDWTVDISTVDTKVSLYPITIGQLRRLAKAVAAVKGGSL